jgi:hypothetical protein
MVTHLARAAAPPERQGCWRVAEVAGCGDGGQATTGPASTRPASTRPQTPGPASRESATAAPAGPADACALATQQEAHL